LTEAVCVAVVRAVYCKYMAQTVVDCMGYGK